MDGRPTWTDCDEAGDYVAPNVLSPRDLVCRPDKHGRNCTTHCGCTARHVSDLFVNPEDWFCRDATHKFFAHT